MSKRILDYNPLTGVTETFEYHAATDTTIIHTTQNVQPILDWTDRLRNDPSYSNDGIKNGMWHYAKIPPVVEMALLKRGIDMHNKNHQEKFFHVIETEFPYLKTTTKVHRPRVS